MLRLANIVAMHKGVDLFDYLDAVLRPVVEEDYQRMLKDETRRVGN